MRILFWGTPDFAVPALRALYGEGHEIVGVVTQPDRPSGRGRKRVPSPVKRWAMMEGIPVLQPEHPRGDVFLERVHELSADISVVVAYGQILRAEVLSAPPIGSINVHASLLPELRGAAPIQWAIIRGYDKTGITIMRMVEELDAGPILMQVEEPIGADESATELALRLAEIGAEALIGTLALLEIGEAEERPQDDDAATYAPRIRREDTRIDWSREARAVAQWARALDAFPGAWTSLDGDELKLYRPRPDFPESGGAVPGTVLVADPAEGLLVACGDGAVWFREVKPAGKRRMPIPDWLRGRPVPEGTRLV